MFLRQKLSGLSGLSQDASSVSSSFTKRTPKSVNLSNRSGFWLTTKLKLDQIFFFNQLVFLWEKRISLNEVFAEEGTQLTKVDKQTRHQPTPVCSMFRRSRTFQSVRFDANKCLIHHSVHSKAYNTNDTLFAGRNTRNPRKICCTTNKNELTEDKAGDFRREEVFHRHLRIFSMLLTVSLNTSPSLAD